MANPISKTQFVGGTVGYLRDYDYADTIFREGPDEARLLTVMNELGMVDTVEDYEFIINDQDLEASVVTVDAVDAGAKTITLVAGQGVNVELNSVLRLDKDNVFTVTAVAVGGNVDKFAVAVAGVASVGTLAQGSVLNLGAPAFGDNSSRPSPKSWMPTGRTDYCQITRVCWGNSRMAASMKSRVPDLVVTENRKSAEAYIKRTIERGILNGTKMKDAGPPLTYYAGGMVEQINSNGGILTDFAATGVSYASLTHADSLRTYARSDTTIVVTSQSVIGLLTTLFSKQVRYTQSGQSTFGVGFTDFLIGARRYRCIPSHHFQGYLADAALLIDPRMGRLVTTKQANGKRNWMILQTDAQDPGQDGQLNVITCDWGVRLNNIQGHGIWTSLDNIPAALGPY